MIVPQKSIAAYELINATEKGIYRSGLEAGYFPIIETPLKVILKYVKSAQLSNI